MQPNIIFILIDDMGWRDLGCYGSSFYETPNLDQLAAQGMLFTDAYAACPVCSPTRASILSGKYPATVGVTDWIGAGARGKLIDAPYLHQLPLEERSIATALRAGGYQTWHVGKWHLGREPFYPQHHGFDVNIGGCHRGQPPSYWSPYGIENLAEGPQGEYLTDRLTDESIRLIEASGKQPFFLNLWHYAVHTPIQAPPELVEKYRAKAERLGLDNEAALEEGEAFPTEHKKHLRVQRRRFQSDPGYAAMVENLDTNIGRLMDALEQSGKAENTMVIFTSDNGGLATAEGSPTTNAPLNEGKGWMYEGGTREPLIVKWPGHIAAGSRCAVPVTSPDFVPTLLQAAGLDAQNDVEGESLLGLFGGETELKRAAIFWHYPHYGNQGGTPGSSMRAGDWKLIEFFEDGRCELYNLRDDLEEQHDLSGEMPNKTAQLRAQLKEWRASVNAKIPENNPDWE